MAESSVGSAGGHLPYAPTVPGSHRAGPCGPGGGPYGRTEYERAISRANGIPGKGKGLRNLGPDPSNPTSLFHSGTDNCKMTVPCNLCEDE